MSSYSGKPQEPKYRPVLKASQIQHIISLCKSEMPISNESVQVISILAPFEAKILNAGIKPAYIEKPPQPTLLDKLGGTPATLASSVHISKEDRWAAAFNKYKNAPTTCTLQEIQDAYEHMYLHDLMSDEDKIKFENGELI